MRSSALGRQENAIFPPVVIANEFRLTNQGTKEVLMHLLLLQLPDLVPIGLVCVLHVDGRGAVRGRAAGAAHGHREAAHPRQHLGLLLLAILPNHHQVTAPRCVQL